MTWQPISTAPKDGTPVWVSNGFAMRIALWWDGKQFESHGSIGGGWRDYAALEYSSRSDLRWPPTHWMPLPPPPTEETK
jgi:hypothetical protein